MAQPTIIVNDREVRAMLQKFPREINGKLKEIIKASGIVAQNEIRRESPVDTGFMRASVRVRRNTGLFGALGGLAGGTGGRFAGTSLSASIGASAYYAKFVEYGTRYQKSNPFTERGYQRTIPKVKRIATKAIDKLVRDLTR